MIRAGADWAAAGAATKSIRPAVASRRDFEIMTSPKKAGRNAAPGKRLSKALFDERRK